jgi:hypothetical protein
MHQAGNAKQCAVLDPSPNASELGRSWERNRITLSTLVLASVATDFICVRRNAYPRDETSVLDTDDDRAAGGIRYEGYILYRMEAPRTYL